MTYISTKRRLRTLTVCEHGHGICSICNAAVADDIPLPWHLIDTEVPS